MSLSGGTLIEPGLQDQLADFIRDVDPLAAALALGAACAVFLFIVAFSEDRTRVD